MSTRWVRWVVVAIGVAAASIAVAGSDVVLDALLQRARAPGTQIVPDRFVRSWDPLTVFFEGPRAVAGPEDHPERFVQMAPEHDGAWTWLDARTLQFRPAEPWPPLKVIDVAAGGARATLYTLLSPPIAMEPAAGARGLPPLETIALTFAEWVEPRVLARMIALEHRALPGIGAGPATRVGAEDFEIKVLDRARRTDPVQYVIVLDDPIPAGRAVDLRVRLSADDSADEARYEARLETAEPFRPVEIGCGTKRLPVSPEGTRHPSERPVACDGGRSVQVVFTSALGAVGPIEARNLVRFEPAVDDLRVWASGNVLELSGAFRADVPYRIALAPSSLRDASGRALEITGESVVWLYFPQQEPFLRWGMGQGIAERRGPVRIPVEGRGQASADLRIYRVDPLNRAFWPFPDSALEVDESQRPPGPGEEPPEWAESYPIPAHEIGQRLAALGSPAFSGVVPLPVGADDEASRFGLDIRAPIDRIAGAGAPGHYLVGLRRFDGAPTRSWVRVQVTDLVLTTVESPTDVTFLVTSLSTGAAVPGATVALHGTIGDEPAWQTLYEGRTDGGGLLRWAAPGGEDAHRSVQRIVVAKADDQLVLDPARAPDRFADGTWLQTGETWLHWAFDDLGYRRPAPQTLVHLFPDRPVYRPGDPVNLKGYVRQQVAGRLTAPEGDGTVVVSGSGGAEWRLPATLSHGNFYVAWEEEEPPTGAYAAAWEDGDGASWGSTSFRVEAYRLPTFEIDLHGPPKGVVANDQPFDVKLAASYYAGGRVAGRPIRWRVTQYPYAWSPSDLEGFAWSSDDRYGAGGPFRASPERAVDGTTSATGEGSIALDPGVEPDARPRTYLVEATVTGADEQTVTDTIRVDAVPAFVLGLKVPRYLERADTIPAQVVAVGPDGKPAAGVSLTVRTIHREWHSVLQASDFSTGEAHYITDVVDVPEGERRLDSAAAPSALQLPIDEAGVWIVEVEARDRLDRVQVVRVDLFAGGAGRTAWEKPKAGTFELTADRDEYVPGQTARIVVRSPFQSGEALAVVETPAGNQYLPVAVRDGRATISVPVRTGWVPSVPVHVLLRRGRVDAPRATASEQDLGKPQTVGGSITLNVAPRENQVQVTLEHPARSLPGKTVPVTVKLRDPSGAPTAGEVTLWLVDRAVLALGKEQRLDPVPDFVVARSSRVELRDTRNLALGLVPTEEMPGGDGAMEEDSLLDNVTVRKDFRPLAYYAPSLQVPASGVLTVDVALPDNLTVFAVRAKASSGAERFGSASGELAVRLPLVVEPALPRFVRVNDAFDAAALARVIEGSGGPGQAQIAVTGLTATGPATRALTLDAVNANPLSWPVVVDSPPVGADGTVTGEVRVKVGVSRSADGAADAFDIALPLRDDRPERFARSVVTVPAGGVLPIPAIPEAARPGSVRRSVVVARDEALVKMASALALLRAADGQDTACRVARGRVAVGLGALRGPLGLEDEQEIAATVAEATAWIPQVLDARGLVAAWPGGTGRVWLTAESLAFLAEAAEAGRPVERDLVAGLERALQAALRSDYRWFLDGEAYHERTAALWGLAVDGRFDAAYFDELARNSRYLAPEGKARTLLAAVRGGVGTGASAKRLTDDLLGVIRTELYQGAPRYAGLVTVGTRSSLIAPSEARQLATIVDALGAVRPDDAKVKLATDALVRLGTADGWGQPNADAAALLALAGRFARATGPAATVTLGAQTITLRETDPVARTFSTDAGALTLTNTSSAPLTVLIASRWVPSAPGSEQAPVQSGFVVEREWLVVEGDAPPKRVPVSAAATLSLRVGDVVEEHVRLVNPADRTDVVLTVPLAGGFDPLNPALATSGPEATPANRTTAPASWVSYGDDRALLAFDRLPKGTYDLYFRVRAMVPGQWQQPAADATATFDRAVTGLSAGARVEIGRAP